MLARSGTPTATRLAGVLHREEIELLEVPGVLVQDPFVGMTNHDPQAFAGSMDGQASMSRSSVRTEKPICWLRRA
jgi:hypothetical protein